MTKTEFMSLKSGDTVYDKLSNRYMQVIEVTQESDWSEGSVRFSWVETQTVYDHSPQDFVKM